MKHTLKLAVSLLTGIVVFLYAVMAPVYAAPGVYMTPPSGTGLTAGQEFSVDIYGSASAAFGVLGTNVSVTYPTNLTWKSQQNANALSGSSLQHNAGSRTVSLTHTTYGWASELSNKKLFTITFQAVSAGNATVDFSQFTLQGASVAKTPSTYSIASPSCPSGQVGTPPNCTTPVQPTAPTTPAPTPTPTPATTTQKSTTAQKATPAAQPTPTTPVAPAPAEPTISDETISVAYDSAKATWTTNEGMTSTFRYGLSPEALDATVEVAAGDAPLHYIANPNKLKLGTTYYYEIATKNSANATVTKAGSFTTKAYPVLLRITQGASPLAGATISLASTDTRYTTSSKGEVSLSLRPGNYTATIKKDSLTETQKFTIKALTIKESSAPDTQIVSVKLAALAAPMPASEPSKLPWIIGGILAFIVATSIVALVAWRRRQALQNPSGYQSVLDSDISVDNSPQSSNLYQPDIQDFATPSAQLQSYDTYAQSYDATQAPVYPELTSDTYVDPAMIPMESQPSSLNLPDEEPVDMWNTPPVAAQYVDPIAMQAAAPPAEAQSTPEIAEYTEASPVTAANEQERFDEQTYSEPQVTDTPPESEVLDASTQVDNTDEVYEYNEDNSMTIYHAK